MPARSGAVSSPNNWSYRFCSAPAPPTSGSSACATGSRCSAMGSVFSVGGFFSTATASISAMPQASSASICTSIGDGSAPINSSSRSGRRCSATSPLSPNTRTNASRWRSARRVSAMRPRTSASSCAISSTCAVLASPAKTTRGASTGVCSGDGGGGPGVSIQSPSRQRSTLVILERICAASCFMRSASVSQPSSTSA